MDMPLTIPMTVVETVTFENEAKGMLDEEAKLELITFLAANPEAGAIMTGTGGVRKVRWARENEGQSGGFRVIYYYYNENIPIFALKVYPKNVRDSLTQGEKNQLKKIVRELVQQY